MKNESYTQNGALQYATTLNANLDLFSGIGSMMNLVRYDGNSAYDYFKKAFKEDPVLALANIYWSRATRLGSGRRDVFYFFMEKMYSDMPDVILDNLSIVPELGYWKDLNNIYDMKWADDAVKSEIIHAYKNAIKDGNALSAKWCPRKGQLARSIRDALEITNKEFRVCIKDLSDTVEQKMSAKQWFDIDYSKVPSIAFEKYTDAFYRNAEGKFYDFITDPNSKICASVMYPHTLIHGLVGVKSKMKRIALDAQWKNLPNYINEDYNILPVIDVSGSMTCEVGDSSMSCMEVAIGLGLYTAENARGKFRNKFITFSESPTMIEVAQNSTLEEKYHAIKSTPWGFSTDIEAVYNLILNQASFWNIPDSDMPNMIMIFSDMQFNMATMGHGHDYNSKQNIHFEVIREKFAERGYTMPSIVFWNLHECDTGAPATADDNVALVSGFSTKMMESVLSGTKIEEVEVVDADTGEKSTVKVVKTNPIDVMKDALRPIVEHLNFDNVGGVEDIDKFHTPNG